MKSFFKTTTFLIAFSLTGWLFIECQAQNDNNSKAPEKISIVASNEQSSSETNGIKASLRLDNSYGSPLGVEIWYDQWASMYSGLNMEDTNLSDFISQHIRNNYWIYFMPTNLFCGPIELRNESGEKVAMLKAEASLLTTYPLTYKISEVSSNYYKLHNAYLGPGFPQPLISPASMLASFQLKDYFKIEKSGEYKLTVWPKIYRRNTTNSDLCERLDLPSISIRLRVEANISSSN